MRRSIVAPLPARLALAFLALAWAGPAAVAQEPDCVVVEQAGAVQVLRAARAELAAVGAPVSAQDAIRTGSAGKVRLECRGGLVIAIGPATRVGIDRYLAPADGSRLEAALAMAFGIVRLITGAPRPGRAVSVETATAVASTRSTEWLVDATARGTGVLALEGRVEVTGAGVTVVLEPGEGTDVAPGAPPSEPRVWGAARRADALARTTF
ncbi:MAG TPA: FecR domain-containing protein [Geminicoccaceae bacterium]|nr:FecR domain-containing protein [Geminicoccaceae bacterium]